MINTLKKDTILTTIKSLYAKYGTILRYLIMGGLTTLVNIVVFWLCYHPLHQGWAVANWWSWLASVLFAFFTNRTIVFHSKRHSWLGFLAEMAAFFGLRIVSLGLDYLCMWLFIDLIGWGALIAKILTQVVVVVTNYIFSKLIFKPTAHP